MVKLKLSENMPLVVILGLAISAVVIICGLVLLHFQFGWDLWLLSIKNPDTAQYWGQIGDFTGGILNPILSFLALIAVVLSLKSQSEETKAAREEAKVAIDFQQRNIETLEAQNRLFDQQSFDSIFFGMLQMHSRNLEGVSGKYGAAYSEARGAGAFERLVDLYGLNEVEFVEGDTMLGPRLESFYRRLFNHANEFAEGEALHVAHYFRTLEQLVRFVDEYVFAMPIIKKRYFSIVSSVLSQSELECVYLFSLGSPNSRLLSIMTNNQMFDELHMGANGGRLRGVDMISLQQRHHPNFVSP